MDHLKPLKGIFIVKCLVKVPFYKTKTKPSVTLQDFYLHKVRQLPFIATCICTLYRLTTLRPTKCPMKSLCQLSDHRDRTCPVLKTCKVNKTHRKGCRLPCRHPSEPSWRPSAARGRVPAGKAPLRASKHKQVCKVTQLNNLCEYMYRILIMLNHYLICNVISVNHEGEETGTNPLVLHNCPKIHSRKWWHILSYIR